MTEQQKTAAQQALETLEQAWAYYQPETHPEFADQQYEDIPVAA